MERALLVERIEISSYFHHHGDLTKYSLMYFIFRCELSVGTIIQNTNDERASLLTQGHERMIVASPVTPVNINWTLGGGTKRSGSRTVIPLLPRRLWVQTVLRYLSSSRDISFQPTTYLSGTRRRNKTTSKIKSNEGNTLI